MGNTYLAVDFGASNGRVIAGTIEDGKICLDEIHRFPNRQIKLGKTLYWDFLSLFEEMKKGLYLASNKRYTVKGIGIDTWGVDFGLINKEGALLSNPVCYRDSRTDGLPDEVFQLIDSKLHYSKCGIQTMPINTLFQLYCMIKNEDSVLKIADKMLFMPDLFSYYLTGVANNEYCIASTSELLDAGERNWNWDLIRNLGLPEHLFGEIIQPCQIRGMLLPEIQKETGLKDVPVIAIGSHDTACAVAAIPCAGENYAFLSSGTWSLLGAEIHEPILNELACGYGFTNEGGVGGKIRFLQNITGLWILQQLMSEWEKRGEGVAYEVILKEAGEINFHSFIDVDSSEFMNPENMQEAIINYCKRKSQEIPNTKSEFVRCVTESLAWRYEKGLKQLNECLGKSIGRLHIIGGGSKNKLLNQLTANYTGLTVSAGPVEATAIGNILVQAYAMNEISSFEELKSIAINSAEPVVFYPEINQ